VEEYETVHAFCLVGYFVTMQWLAVTAAVILTGATSQTAGAQQWNDPRALGLVREAAGVRARQLADSGLVDYQAAAHGYLTFLAQLGEGFREPPRVVKADELALEVYWRAPNLSKQRIIGQRDTTLLPTDIQYHRDHLGIVQNNFPAIIRLGDGDEVRDVPHPLSETGLREYDFALTDSLRISIPGRVIGVYEVKVRPRDEGEARVIGALYLDRDNAQVVRMALSFTRAAFLDKQLEDLFVVLENGLVGTRFWLPRRQEIEIRRTATWMDYPVRGIIRGRWEIGDYTLNPGLPLSRFAGPEIVQAPPEERAIHVWSSARILDSLPPDIRAVTADEIRRVQTEVRALVRGQALSRVRGSALAARGVSDFLRFNRVEGLAFGLGVRGRLGGGMSVAGVGRYGMDDRDWKLRAELGWQDARGRSARLHARRDFQDVGEVAERSLLVNSLAAQEFGSDHTDPFLLEAVGAAFTFPLKGINWTLDVSREHHAPLMPHASPATGHFEPTVPADTLRAFRWRISAEHPTRLRFGGFELRARADIAAIANVLRGSLDVEFQRELGANRLIARTIGGGAHSRFAIPVQELVYLGGPLTAPGYEYHTFVSEAAVSQRIELQLPIPFPAISLGRFGRSAARATLSPFVTAVALSSPGAVAVGSSDVGGIVRIRGSQKGVYPSVGAGLLLFFDLLRVDAARGLRDGRWSFYLDVNRAFWSVL
jgi:hypothetical protein